MDTFRGQINMVTWVIEVTELVMRPDVASEAVCRPPWPQSQTPPKWFVRGNMHNDNRVIEVSDFKSEVKFEF